MFKFKQFKKYKVAIAARKLLTVIISVALLFGEGYFAQIVYAVSGENSSSQYNPNHALNNVKDNPI
ncbi:MAG: hypothetical protein LBV16_08815, partial [Elusimicrobiota bacterium]|nr:hypothetical protein [Elusimicrobiota bacterium]